jgi:ubiquinone/menaquinone biosynthesis C-methylase UbiE
MRISTISRINFGLMALCYKFRDLRRPRIKILREVGIKQGSHVLDYGCGPASYLLSLAELVGDTGRIYALDADPLAVRAAERIAARNKLANVSTILTDCSTGLPSGSIDIVLLYDILHDLTEPEKVLAELHRVLKQEGKLSINDHHLKDDEVVSRVTGDGLFASSVKGDFSISFAKKNQ